MQALQRLVIMGTVVGLAVFTAGNPAVANSALLEKQGALSSGDDMLEDGSLYDRYSFLGSSGQPIIIYLESQEFDPYLILLDPTGRRISENDDISRTNRNSRLIITLPSEGTYTVLANSYEAGKVGVYKLQVVNNQNASSVTTRLIAQAGTEIKASPLLASSQLAFSEPEVNVTRFNLQIDD